MRSRKFNLFSSAKIIDFFYHRCYVLSAYMTDGSGNDHGEYKRGKPTVWAECSDSGLFSLLLFIIYLKRREIHEDAVIVRRTEE